MTELNGTACGIGAANGGEVAVAGPRAQAIACGPAHPAHDDRERAALWQQVVEALAFGIVQVDGDWRLLYANAAAQAMLRDDKALSLREGCLVIRPASAQDRARRWLRDVASGVDCGFLAVARASGAGPVLFECLSAQADASGDVRCLLALVDTGRAASVSVQRLTAALALTAAEARLVAALVEGRSLHDFAREEGIALKTARKHLENAFARTGVRRQSALVKLAITCAPPLLGRGQQCSPPRQPMRGDAARATANAAVGRDDSRHPEERSSA